MKYLQDPIPRPSRKEIRHIRLIDEASHLKKHHTTLPNRITLSFSGHETFPFRYTWLKKGVDAVRADSTIFTNDKATIVLGVGKNMVRSIRHWCVAARLIKEERTGSHDRGRLVSTRLGESIFADDGFDPYLEDAATLWLIHWHLATNRNRTTTWFWAFSIFNQTEFSKDRFILELLNWVEESGRHRTSENSIKRDVECFFRTYVPSRMRPNTVMEDTFDCPIVELGLIAELSEGTTYQFHRGPKPSLPTGIFAVALTEFWDTCFAARNTVALADIAHSPNSPGRIFKLDEDTLVEHLENLANLPDDVFRYDETAGIKQVYRNRKVSSTELLRSYYAQSRGNPLAFQPIEEAPLLEKRLYE